MGPKEIGLIAGAAPIIGAKFWVGKKWVEHRRRKQRERAGTGMPLNEFAKLPRRKQAGIIGYRRGRLSEFENVYYRGGKRRRRGLYR